MGGGGPTKLYTPLRVVKNGIFFDVELSVDPLDPHPQVYSPWTPLEAGPLAIPAYKYVIEGKIL